MPMPTVLAIEIDSPTTWEVLTAFDPHFGELSYEENLGNFVIPNYDGSRWMIMTPKLVGEIFDHLEPSKERIKFVNLVS